MPPPVYADDSDSEEEARIKKDEYGDLFEDYGFLKRAEEHKEKGNVEFKKERFERSLKEYDMALEALLTVAYDKSIVLGQRKWNDVIVLRSTIHLNKSTCHYKLERWQQAADEAQECLIGNIRDEQMFTDPHIRHKVKQSEKKHGRSDVKLQEERLPRPLRAKAWFRLSRCHAQLNYIERAREAQAKALEMCDDDNLLVELSNHSLRIDVLERQQKERQKKQFRGFWDKLQERGGYVERRAEKEQQRKAEWDSLNYEQRFSKVQELDDSEDEDEDLMPRGLPARAAQTEELQAGLEDCLKRNLGPGVEVRSATVDLQRAAQQALDQNFDAYWKGKGQAEMNSEDVPSQRPDRKEEAPFRWAPGGEPRSEHLPGPEDAAEVWARRQEEATRQERQWRMDYDRRRRSEQEDEELARARERLAEQRLQKAQERARRQLDKLDCDSDED